MSMPIQDRADAVRRFNRFYTRRLGWLGPGLHDSPFSLTQARILYELAQGSVSTAGELSALLGLDPGHMSRLIAKLAGAGLVSRRASQADRRQTLLGLTDAGRAAFAGLDRASAEQAAKLLGSLPDGAAGKIVAAMAEIERLIEPPATPPPFVLRPHRVGDIGWIARRQGMIYHREYGWDGTFEALVAEILAAFVRDFDPRHEQSWVATRDGEIVGSVFLVRQSDEVAKLRLLYVEAATRGQGLGALLVAECIAAARARGYSKLVLWTNDILVAARRIYLAQGFRLVAEERHRSFGKDLVGQNWELEL